MKKALLFSVVAVFAATVVSAEVVESISFNPSRMGKYKQLKVAKQATFPGGLKVTEEMNLRSSGEVTLQYDVANNDEEKKLNLTDLIGEYRFAEVSFPEVYFQGNGGMTVSYKADAGNYSGNVLEDVSLSGGDISFEGGDSYGDSYIDSLVDAGDGGNTIQATSNVFVGNALKIGDKQTAGAVLANGETIETIAGFHLAGNDIPFPRVGEVEHRGASNEVSLDLTNNNCKLAWVVRNATIQENGSSTTKKVKVLALSGCDALNSSASSACSSDAENSCKKMGGSWDNSDCYCEVSVANPCSKKCAADERLTSNCCCEKINCGKEMTPGNFGHCQCVN